MTFCVSWKILNFQRKECLKYFNREKNPLYMLQLWFMWPVVRWPNALNFFLCAGSYFPWCLILERKMAQETHEGLYGHRHISGNVKCTWILWKWKSIRTWAICSAALLRHTSYTYLETLGSWPSLHSKLSLSSSHFSKEKYIICVGKPALSGKITKDLNFEFWQNFFS